MPANICTKNRYATVSDAIGAMKSIRRRGTGSGRLPVSLYPCQWCIGSWHLTSRKPTGAKRSWWEKFAAE